MKLVTVILISILSVTPFFLFRKDEDESLKYVVAMYRWGWNADNLDELKDSEYVEKTIETFERIRAVTRGEKSKLLDYIVQRMRFYGVPVDINATETAKEIIDSLDRNMRLFSLDIPIELVLAMMESESRFDPFAASKAYLSGKTRYPAYGLFQIWAPTFFWINDKYFSGRYDLDDLFDIDVNVKVGMAILNEIMKNVPGGS